MVRTTFGAPGQTAVITSGTKLAGLDQPAPLPDQDGFELLAPARLHQPATDAGASAGTSRASGPIPDPVVMPALETPTPATTGTTIGTAFNPPVRSDAGTPPAVPPALSNPLDLRQPDWDRTLGRQLSWMVNNRTQEAEIKVNPPDLGPLEVRVSLHRNQTSVAFFCHEAAVRDAIETALPRLRDMLESQGITLHQAQVSDQSLAGRQSSDGGRFNWVPRGGESFASAPATKLGAKPGEFRAPARRLPGVVDHYV